LRENLTLLMDIVFFPDAVQKMNMDEVSKMGSLIEEVSNAGHGVETSLGMCQIFMPSILGKRISWAGTKTTHRALADFRADKPAADFQAMFCDVQTEPMDVEFSETNQKELEHTLAMFRDRASKIATLKTLILELPTDPLSRHSKVLSEAREKLTKEVSLLDANVKSVGQKGLVFILQASIPPCSGFHGITSAAGFDFQNSCSQNSPDTRSHLITTPGKPMFFACGLKPQT
jgi:hypothetical protein